MINVYFLSLIEISPRNIDLVGWNESFHSYHLKNITCIGETGWRGSVLSRLQIHIPLMIAFTLYFVGSTYSIFLTFLLPSPGRMHVGEMKIILQETLLAREKYSQPICDWPWCPTKIALPIVLRVLCLIFASKLSGGICHPVGLENLSYSLWYRLH